MESNKIYVRISLKLGMYEVHKKYISYKPTYLTNSNQNSNPNFNTKPTNPNCNPAAAVRYTARLTSRIQWTWPHCRWV